MKTKTGVSIPSKRAVLGMDNQSSSLLQAKRTSRLKLVVAWSVVMLPLTWGLYETGRIVAPLIRTLLLHSR